MDTLIERRTKILAPTSHQSQKLYTGLKVKANSIASKG